MSREEAFTSFASLPKAYQFDIAKSLAVQFTLSPILATPATPTRLGMAGNGTPEVLAACCSAVGLPAPNSSVSKNSLHIGAKKQVWILPPVYSCVIWNSTIVLVFFKRQRMLIQSRTRKMGILPME